MLEHGLMTNVVWTYMESPKNRKDLPVMELCLETIKRNTGSCDLRVVTPDNVRDYLPKLRTDIDEKLRIPGRADVIRVQLLKEYGGLWLDADIILFKEPTPFLDKLKDYDFVVMGQINPDNWLLAAKKGEYIIEKWAERQNQLLDAHGRGFFNRGYFALGRDIMRPLMQGRSYFAFPPHCAGGDSLGNEILSKYLFRREVPEKACLDKRIIMHLRHPAPGFPGTFRVKSKEEILEGGTMVGNMFRHALGMKEIKLKSRGLGDTVAKVTKAVGIKQCGGCGGRQEILNRLVPYKNGSIKAA